MTHGMVPEDLLRMVWVQEPEWIPGTDDVVYVRRWCAPDGRRYHSQIHHWSSGQDRPLTNGSGVDYAPRVSPNGRQVAFLSDRGGSVQLWCLPLAGGEARPLTDLPFAPSAAVWAPDSRRLLFTVPVAWETDTLPGYADDVIVVRQRHYRTNGERLQKERHRQLYVLDVDGGMERLTLDRYDYGVPAWSPDGCSLAVSARRADDADGALFRDLWRLDLPDKRWTVLTENLVVQQPAWSPDGQQLAAVFHDGRYGRATSFRLGMVPADGTTPMQAVVPGWDVEAGSHILSDMNGLAALPGPIWTPDGGEILMLGDEGGAARLYAVPVAGGTPRPVLGGPRTFHGLTVDPRCERYVLAASHPQDPGSLYRGVLGGAESLITQANPWIAERRLSKPERFWSDTPDGLRVEAWVLPPLTERPGRHPTVVEIHGGPHAAYGETFMLEFQMLAGAGIGVVYSNPRGSTGYGQDHCTPVQDHWGVGASTDVLAVLDAAVAKFPWIDTERLGITGGSFGGYLTNWILTQTVRFRAAIAQRSVSNRYSFVGTSDMGFRGMEEYGGPWAHPDHYRDSSPIAYADRITTPLLLIHAEEDWRCPIEQAEQLFMALKMLGRDVELVRYPGENHELSRAGRPYHRIDRLWRILRWFAERLRAGEP